MASRYPTIKVIDYCFNPIHLRDEDKDIIVPCNKCDGCLLHNANEWSMRCGMEIEDSPATIFFTLTYNNKYIPKLAKVSLVGSKNVVQDIDAVNKDYIWISDNPGNVRFNGVRDVQREDNIVIRSPYSPIPLENFNNVAFPNINYGSKRDIQLWLKLLRKDLYEYGFTPDKKRGLFRYFIGCEVGPTTFRSHFHGLLFCSSREISETLLNGTLYKNWQMCDEDLFTKYAHLCDSGARGYVTNYITSISELPRVYKENTEVRPYHLSSKSPAIGFIGQDKQKIFEDVSRGIIRYSRKIHRLESSSILEYPSDYLSTIFPKCYQFNKISDSRRFHIYSYLYRAVRNFRESYILLRSRLSKVLNAADYLATCACYRFCREYVDSPLYYYYLLDMYYYKVDMEHLKSFYESQQKCDFSLYPEKIFEYYPNIELYALDKDNMSDSRLLALALVLSPLGLDYSCIVGNKSFFLDVRKHLRNLNRDYRNEVFDIRKNMVKTAKHNELTGSAPTSLNRY